MISFPACSRSEKSPDRDHDRLLLRHRVPLSQPERLNRLEREFGTGADLFSETETKNGHGRGQGTFRTASCRGIPVHGRMR